MPKGKIHRAQLCELCEGEFFRHRTARFCSYKCRGDAREPRRPIDDRFFEKVDKSGNCWLWTGTINAGGYGLIWNRRADKAHRVSYVIHKGAIPDGKMVLHACDVRNCVNPEHLYVGDAKQNARDMEERHRHPHIAPKGEQHHHAKLTNSDVLEIRRRDAAGESRAAIAASFGIVPPTVSKISSGRSWAHL